MDGSESDSEIAGNPVTTGGTLDLFGSSSDLGKRPAKPTPRPAPVLPTPPLPAIIDLQFEAPTSLTVIVPEASARLERIFAALRETRSASRGAGYDTPDASDAEFISALDLGQFTDRYITGAPVFLKGQCAWQSAVLRHRLVEPLLGAKSGCHTEPLDNIVSWLVKAGFLHEGLADIRKEEVDDICSEFLGFRRPQDIIGSWFDSLWAGRLAAYRFDEFESSAWVFLNDRSLADARGVEYVPWASVIPPRRPADAHAETQIVETTFEPDPEGPWQDTSEPGYGAVDDMGEPPVFEQVPLELYEEDEGREPPSP